VREESRSMHVHWFVKIGEREEEIRCMVSWPAISHVPRKRASQNSLMECDGRGADNGVLQDGLETIRERASDRAGPIKNSERSQAAEI
jgi:hypothetical protein